MKLHLNILLIAALSALTGTTGAVSPRKQYVVSYPQDTDQSVLEQAMDAIKKAGGFITHEYNIIKGFAVEASEEALETVQALGATSNVVIEEDQVFSTNND